MKPFRAFEVRGFPWLVLNGIGLSITFSLEGIAQAWLVLRETDSVFWVGASSGVYGMAQFLFSFPGGALADRFDRRKVLMTIYALAAVGNAAMTALVVTEAVELWHILLFMAFIGATLSLSSSSRNSLMADVVDMRRLLNHDHLTGAANRRHFGEVLKREQRHWRELRQSLSLIVLDLDHFKAVNDTHGHPVGDTLLRRVTDVCTALLPPCGPFPIASAAA